MVTWTRVRYRITQFFSTLWTSLRPVDTAYAAHHLSPTLLSLFQRMARAEQHHGIAICRNLEAQGYADPDLLAVALLHDAGKVLAPPYLWERVMVVLGEHFLPAQTARWSKGEPHGLRRGFVVRRMHPRWGAELARQAGASRRTIEWIERHHASPGDDAQLAALQAADE